MKKRILFWGLIVSFLVGTAFAGVALAREAPNVVFGSGQAGGPWRMGVGAAVQMLNEQLKDKYAFTAAASGGSVENMRRLARGEYHTIWVQVNNMMDAWQGVGLFEGQKPFQDVRVVAYIADQAVCIATLAKSPIRNLSDLAGKRVNIGPPGSGGIPVAMAIFRALGITDKVKIVNLSMEAGAQALRDGQIDVSMTPGGPVPPAIVELARSVPVRLVEPTPEEAKKIDDQVPYLRVGVIPANRAPGENADRERRALFWSMYWAALASLPDEVVYDMLRVIQEPKNKELLGKVVALWATSGANFEDLVRMRIPLHPGAVRYWREQGVKIPAEIVPR